MEQTNETIKQSSSESLNHQSALISTSSNQRAEHPAASPVQRRLASDIAHAQQQDKPLSEELPQEQLPLVEQETPQPQIEGDSGGGDAPPITPIPPADGGGEVPVPTQEVPVMEAGDPLVQAEQEAATVELQNTELPAPKPLATPESDPDFQAAVEQVSIQGDKEQDHSSGAQEAAEAKKAAPEAPGYKTSHAQSHQMGDMEQQQTPAFDTGRFVEALMAKINAIMPKSEKEADEFDGRVAEVQNAVTSKVETAKEGSVSPLEQATKETPNVGAIPSKEVQPLQGNRIGSGPKDIGAEKAMPKPVGQDRIEQPLEHGSKQLDAQLEQGNLTEQQLQQSNEPSFIAALEQKKGAQQDSEQAATQLRQDEEQERQTAQSNARQEGQTQMGAMHQDRASIMTQVNQQQQTGAQSYSAEEQKVADHINGIYNRTKTSVEGLLSRLDGEVSSMFERGAQRAQRNFESYVNQKMEAYKDERYSLSLGGAARWVGDAFTGLPDEVNQFFIDGRRNYVNEMRGVIQRIATHVASALRAAKERVQEGREQVKNYVESLPNNLRTVGNQLAQEINSKFQELDAQIDAKQNELIDNLAQQYKDTLDKLDTHIENIQAASRGLIDRAMEAVQGVVETIAQLRSMLTQVIGAAVGVVTGILADPIGFLGNLISGVGQGFQNFLSKASDHLKNGFVEWLTGAVASTGIQIPEDVFSLQGIFDLTSQALGLTWDFIRERAVGILGERPVQAIEESFGVFQILQEEGLAGAWEHLKEQFGDLKETILGSITSMIVTEVVQGGIQYILALLTPAGAFLKAVDMIVSVAQFFLNQGAQVLEMVQAFVDAISAIASGAVGAVAQKIEQALVVSIPVLIGFFASLLKLGDVAKKVRAIFQKITGRIHGAIDGLIEKAGAWFKDKKGRRRERREARRRRRNGEADRDERRTQNRQDEEESSTRQNRDRDQDEETAPKEKINQAIRRGRAIVNKDGLTKRQIRAQLEQLREQLRIQGLEADLISETEEWHTFMLKARAGNERKQVEIKRKPTLAQDEEAVSDADRQLHQRIAQEVEERLQIVATEEEIADFQALYSALRLKSRELVRTYQPQLREGITIAVDLINTVQQDQQDGDVDVHIKIAPNTVNIIREIGMREGQDIDTDQELTAVAEFEEAIHTYNTQSWQAEKYAELLRKQGRGADITVLQDELLLELYEAIKIKFENDMPKGHTYKTELKGGNPGRKLLYLLDQTGKTCANTTLAYIGGEELNKIDELREHIDALLQKAKFIPASEYKKHVKGTSEEQRSQNSENGGAGQYFYRLNDRQIEDLERKAIKNGTPQKFREKVGEPQVGDDQYYFLYSLSDDVGYVNGLESNRISVEITSASTNPEIHSHPR